MSAGYRGGRRAATLRGQRLGVTVLEFLGCVTAVLGGAWIGALYLGVNVQHLAHDALEQAQLLEKIPVDWRPEGSKQNVVTREQMIATLKKEIGSLRSEIIALHAGNGADPSQPMPVALATARRNTQNYWQKLSEIALNEQTLQRDAETAIDETNAANVFAIKGRVARFSAKSIEAVPTEGVDESVVKFGRQLVLWYDRAGELYERAVRIWETPTGQQARTQLTEEWKRADLQHRHEARLMRDRAAALRGSISRQFADEFPEFAAPATAVEPIHPAKASEPAVSPAVEPAAAPAVEPTASPAAVSASIEKTS
jgi:hypothetical protein